MKLLTASKILVLNCDEQIGFLKDKKFIVYKLNFNLV